MKTYTVLLILAFMAITYLGHSQTNELTIPLSDPAKRGKLKAYLNSGSITVKGTARKDVLVKYSVSESEDGDEDEREEEHENNNKNQSQSAPPKTGLKKIGGGGIDLQITE